MNEFEIIQKFFTQSLKREDIILGSGDDCALVYSNQPIAITTDTLIEGVHFLKNTSAYDIGYKALAVNLSDLAAMGAEPAWITIALTIPEANELWLTEFSQGLFELANRFKIQLIGGDLTKGSLQMTISAYGFIPASKALRRNAAIPGDLIYVTHTIGDAALALSFLLKKTTPPQTILKKLTQPEPRIEIGKKLREIAHAAIDISDGLAADLNHILKKSHVGAILYVDQLPLSHFLCESVSSIDAIEFALYGGDDYELCFTIPPDKINDLSFDCTCVGEITKNTGLNLLFSDGKKYYGKKQGYQHFL